MESLLFKNLSMSPLSYCTDQEPWGNKRTSVKPWRLSYLLTVLGIMLLAFCLAPHVSEAECTHSESQKGRLWRSTLRKHWNKDVLNFSLHLQQQLSFFVEKKDWSLQPCIDFWGLHSATEMYRYPLALIPSALEQVKDAKNFIKLDLKLTRTISTVEKVLSGGQHSLPHQVNTECKWITSTSCLMAFNFQCSYLELVHTPQKGKMAGLVLEVALILF